MRLFVLTCALCKREEQLKESHLIPKLVYRRIRSHPNSRFRSLDNITKVWQDGEKYEMLCHDCEEKFSALETYFAKHFLDPYLADEQIPTVDDPQRIEDYILSVAWRILWDDLYRLNSFEGHIRSEYESFEENLRDYLLNDNIRQRESFSNRIYRLKDLISCPESFAEGSLFGYCYYPNVQVGCLVLVYYAGLVFVTRYWPPRKSVMFLDDVPHMETNIDTIVCEEMIRQFSEMIKQENEKMTPELRGKIKKHYGI